MKKILIMSLLLSFGVAAKSKEKSKTTKKYDIYRSYDCSMTSDTAKQEALVTYNKKRFTFGAELSVSMKQVNFWPDKDDEDSFHVYDNGFWPFRVKYSSNLIQYRERGSRFIVANRLNKEEYVELLAKLGVKTVELFPKKFPKFKVNMEYQGEGYQIIHDIAEEDIAYRSYFVGSQEIFARVRQHEDDHRRIKITLRCEAFEYKTKTKRII